MSTRSVVAIPYGDAWRGRYVHSDGYPTHMGPTLFAMVRRSGLQAVTSVLTDQNYGWSYLDAAQPDIVGVEADGNAPWGSAAKVAAYFDPTSHYGSYSDGRFANVPDYGIAYTTVSGQSAPDDWIVPDADNWTEWTYVLTVDGLVVIETPYSQPSRGIGLYRWTDEPVWASVEYSGVVTV